MISVKKKTIYEIVGMNIRIFSWKKDLSQKKLSELTGIAPATICKIEGGKVNPSLFMLERIANALDVEVKDLFNSGESS